MASPHLDFPVSWDELHRNARALAWRLSERGAFEGVVAITRGGLVPAAIVAREYRIPSVMKTREATRHIVEGQHIIVDGDQGIVELEPNGK